MSGGDGAVLSSDNLQAAERIGQNFALSQNIKPDEPNALQKLRALSAEEVTAGLNLATMRRVEPAPTIPRPFADGTLVVDGKEAYRSGRFVHVPILIGSTSGDVGGKDGFMVAGARTVATTLAARGVPVYVYRFSYVAESVPKDPATATDEAARHASDIPFFFDTQAVKYGPATTARDKEMGTAISAYLVNFAKKGNPNGTGLPGWPRFDPKQAVIMDFSPQGIPVAGVDPWSRATDPKP